jgi:NAD(P)-dependent dehydrogenase (short-subunit alcohol dehydrogenase family)
LNVNLRGVYLCSRAAVPHLKEGGWGRIVSIASDAGKRGELYSAHYCASKFGVIGLTQVLGLELARTGVTANAVCPTITSTAMMQQFGTAMSAVSGDDVDSVLQQAVNDIPMGRPTAPEDVAAAVSFLCSDDASFFTGQSLNVTGGGWMM